MSNGKFFKPASSLVNLVKCLILLLPLNCAADTLDQLISAALRGHPSILAQRAQMQAAESGVDTARWQFFPTPSIAIENATASASDRNYQGDSTATSLRLQQPLWTGGRLTAGMDKAEASVIVSQASLEETRQQLALRVVQSYGDWLAAYLKTQAYEKSQVTHARLHAQVKQRIAQGVSSESDLIQAIARQESLAADISVARAQKDVALARLGQLLGRPINDASLTSQFSIPRPVSAELPVLLNQALLGNPAVNKAQAQAKVQESVIDERRADLSPEVYLRAEQQYGNYSYRDSPSESRLFIGLSSRFGAGLSSLSNVEGAKSQYQAALAEIEVQSRIVNEQVLADYALATSTEGRLVPLKASVKAAEDVSQSYDRQFLAGRKTWLDVMNAARELTQTEVQLAEIKASHVVVTWRLAIYTEGLASMIGRAP